MGWLRGTLVAIGIGGSLALFTTGQAFAFKVISFDGKFTRWNDPEIRYVVDEDGSDDFDGGCDGQGPCVSLREAVRRSFQSWTDVQGVNLRFDEESPRDVGIPGYNHKNELVWVENGWQSLSFTPPPEALAVTISTYKTSNSEIVDSDIFFNGESFRWANIDTEEEKASNVIDVQNIATHEIGHFIGLDHSSENIFEANTKLYLATMFFASGPGETFRRELKEDDDQASLQLYPEYEVEQPQVAEASPSTVDLTATQTATVTISGRGFAANSTALLAISGDRGDVIGTVVSVNDREMTVAFDVYGLELGSYDLVVTNAYDRSDRLEGGITLTGAGGYVPPDANGGSSAGGGCAAGSAGGAMALLIPLLLIGLARFQLTGKPAWLTLRRRRRF